MAITVKQQIIRLDIPITERKTHFHSGLSRLLKCMRYIIEDPKENLANEILNRVQYKNKYK